MVRARETCGRECSGESCAEMCGSSSSSMKLSQEQEELESGRSGMKPKDSSCEHDLSLKKLVARKVFKEVFGLADCSELEARAVRHLRKTWLFFLAGGDSLFEADVIIGNVSHELELDELSSAFGLILHRNSSKTGISQSSLVSSMPAGEQEKILDRLLLQGEEFTLLKSRNVVAINPVSGEHLRFFSSRSLREACWKAGSCLEEVIIERDLLGSPQDHLGERQAGL